LFLYGMKEAIIFPQSVLRRLKIILSSSRTRRGNK
jgi:hypothetical protein